jgi:hypothetical protein
MTEILEGVLNFGEGFQVPDRQLVNHLELSVSNLRWNDFSPSMVLESRLADIILNQ